MNSSSQEFSFSLGFCFLSVLCNAAVISYREVYGLQIGRVDESMLISGSLC